MSDFFGAAITPGPGEPLVIVAEGWDPRTGPNYTLEWRGREQEIRLQQAIEKSKGRKTDLRRPGEGEKRWILQSIASASETEDPNQPLLVKWSLKRNLLEKNLWEHPAIAAAMDSILPTEFNADANLTIKRVARMRHDFDAFVRGDETTTKENGETVALTTDVLAAHIIVLGLETYTPFFIQFLRARLRGAEAVPMWSWVLRKTTLVFETSTVRPNKENVGKILSADIMKAQEGLDDQNIIGVMPDGIWLKTPCEVDRADSGGPDKWEFVQEYWQALEYEKFIYGEIAA
jgi:hypothetical protein